MINCKLTSVQQWSAFNTHQWIICTSRARIFMAVYVSLISKYKFSQAKRFLVKPNAKFRPTSDRVFQARCQHRRFLGGRKLNSPARLSCARRHRWAGASLVSVVLHQAAPGAAPQHFPSLAGLPPPQKGDTGSCPRPRAGLEMALCMYDSQKPS